MLSDNMKELVVLLLIAGLAAADNWTMNGSGVYWTSDSRTITCSPAYSESTDGWHTQYCNFTSANPNSVKANITLVFDRTPYSADALLWTNTSREETTETYGRHNTTARVENVLGYNTTSLPCEVGDEDNPMKRAATYLSNGTQKTTVFCFFDYANDGSTYTLNYTYTGYANKTATVWRMGWKSIAGLFTASSAGGHRTYTIKDVGFTNGTNYRTMFKYKAAGNGKFDIYAHSGSPQEAYANPGLIYVALDPWYSATTNVSTGVPLTTQPDTDNHQSGVQVIVGATDLNLTTICRASGVTATNACISTTISSCTSGCSCLASAAFSTDCVAVAYTMKNQTAYWISVYGTGGDFNHRRNATNGGTMPWAGTNSTLLTWNTTWTGYATTGAQIRDIDNITVKYAYLVQSTPNISISTTVSSYNGTRVNYTLTANAVTSSQATDNNISIWANGTLLGTWITNLSANTPVAYSASWSVARPALDGNFTASANISGADVTTTGASAFLMLPIDPPSAINLMSLGGKDACRTPQDVGYWDGRAWNINTSHGCNYTSLNLKTQLTGNITYSGAGTTTFSNSNITASFFRLAGDLTSGAVFIFKSFSSLWAR